jgi:hypothetical protein
MARKALVGVEAGTKAIVRSIGHDFYFLEPAPSILKERCFVRGKTVQRTASACRATAHTRIHGTFAGLSQIEAASGQRHGDGCTETLEGNSPVNSHDEPPKCRLAKNVGIIQPHSCGRTTDFMLSLDF